MGPDVNWWTSQDHWGAVWVGTWEDLDGQVNAHFGRTQAFLVAEAEGGAVKESTVYEVAGLEHDHSGLAGFLASRGVDVILAGGMGRPMQQALVRAGFDLYCGVAGSATQAVDAFLGGEIAKSETTCGHHHGHGGGAGAADHAGHGRAGHGGGADCAGHEGHAHGEGGCARR